MSKFPTPYKWLPTNPNKYVGDVGEIWIRSSWEKKACIWFDTTDSILKWSSETVVIPYVCPTDNRPHRYFVDFAVQYKTKTGEIKRALVEVKPHAQTIEPKAKKTQNKRYITEVTTFVKNKAKWEAAEAWCKTNGFVFMILDEFSLGISKRK